MDKINKLIKKYITIYMNKVDATKTFLIWLLLIIILNIFINTILLRVISFLMICATIFYIALVAGPAYE